MINSIIDRASRRFQRIITKALIRDVDILLPVENEVFFCFTGEFGYELISWIPYLIYLKKTTGIKINTMSRPGSKMFYDFSDQHIELQPGDINGMWGNYNSYKMIAQRTKIKKIIHPCNEAIDLQKIIVNGYEWKNKNIHIRISEENYNKLDLSNINDRLPFNFKKFVVINNKYTKFKSNDFSPNYFDKLSLTQLKALLLKHGYSIVYNRFIEKTATDTEGFLDDAEIFSGQDCYDMQNFYANTSDPLTRNRIQVSAYNKASFVIGIQGGNIYLPSFCKKDILMLMRDGDYIDYTELARLYSTNIDVFYEPKHLLLWLENVLSKKS